MDRSDYEIDVKDNNQLLDRFISTKRSESTKKSYRQELRTFSEWVKKPLIDVGLGDMSAYDAYLNKKYDKDTTIQRIYSTIRSFYKWLLQMRYVSENPAEIFQQLTPSLNPNSKVLTKNELLALKKAAEDNARSYALLALLATTGLRANEVLSLNWNDLMQTANDDYVFRVIRKGGKDEMIPVREDALEALLRYKREPVDPKDDSPVFKSFYGQQFKRMSPDTTEKIIAGLAKKAGIERPVTPHWLRHTYASQCLANGAPLRDVQFSLGHSHITTTELYLRPLNNKTNQYYPVEF